jgi:hypothetical protein
MKNGDKIEIKAQLDTVKKVSLIYRDAFGMTLRDDIEL